MRAQHAGSTDYYLLHIYTLPVQLNKVYNDAIIESLYLVKCWREFKTIPEKTGTSQDVQPEASSGHGHDQTTNISQMTSRLGANERQDDVIVLLPLVPIHRGDLENIEGGLVSNVYP